LVSSPAKLKKQIMKKCWMVLPVLFLALNLFGQAPKPYKMWTPDGEWVDYEKMLQDMAAADVVLFGEIHNNSFCHWMQLQVSKDLYAVDSNLVMGAEMFEADNQLLIDEYLSGDIRQRNFEDEMKLWNNYQTDYKPLLEFARENGIYFVASNVPRRYAALVNKEGLESLERLTDEAKRFLPPLPIPFDTLAPNYHEMLNMSMGGHGMGGNMLNMVKAQAIKDATMAHFIDINLKAGQTLLHFQGDFHSKNHGAIAWYLKQYRPELRVVTLSTVEAGDDLEFREEYGPLADYILVIAADMTKTY
jgi:uncharacterized iron-regulated protein